MAGNPVETFLSTTTDTFNEEHQYFKKEASYDRLQAMLREVSAIPDLSPLDRALILDFTILLPSVLLPKVDIASMQHAVETRAPFLGADILNLAGKISSSLKIKGTTTKFPLREIAKKYLPLSITTQPKRGFEIPLISWTNGVLKPVINDLLDSPNALYLDFMDKKYVRGLLLENSSKIHPQRRAKQLFVLMGLEIWNKNRMNLR